MSLEAYIFTAWFALGLIPALGILAVPKARDVLFRGAAWYGISKRQAIFLVIVLCICFGVPMMLYVQLHRPSKEELETIEELRER